MCRFPRWILGVSCLVLAVARVLAHDPYEITTDAWIRANSFEVTSTLARSTAATILEKSGAGPVDAAKFEELKARLEETAKDFYLLTARGEPLPLVSASAALTIEQDVELKLVYARPPLGSLEIRAPHVTALGYGYGNVFTAHGERGALLGQEMLAEGQPAMQIEIKEAPPVSAPAAAKAAAAPVGEPVVADAPAEGFNYRAALVAVAVVALVFWWLQRRRGQRAVDQE